MALRASREIASAAEQIEGKLGTLAQGRRSRVPSGQKMPFTTSKSRATPEQWTAWNAAARLSGVPVEIWLTQAGDAHARNLRRAVARRKKGEAR